MTESPVRVRSRAALTLHKFRLEKFVEQKTIWNNSAKPRSRGRLNKKNVTEDRQKIHESVAWGIDSHEDDIWHFHKVIDILRLWAGLDEKIIPLSVVSPDEFESDMWPRENLKDLRQELKFEIKEQIGDFLEKIDFQKSRMKVLFTERESQSALVERFLRYASREKAELIALLSQTSHKSKVMGLGSFSEHAIATSKIPVMIVSDETQVPSNLKKFLFTTDFSIARKKAFQETLKWAKRYGAEVILYHQVGTSVTPGNQDRNLKLSEAWIKEARLNNVSCRIEREDIVGGWSERISAVAQAQKVSVIVIPIRRRRWQQMLFGGKIRKTLSEATCPLIFCQS